MTASHSSSDMLKSIRSRRMPATATTPSIRPHRSTAVLMMRSPPAIELTSSATATASPPAASISFTTASATALVGSSPARPTPMSATTTLAPSAAQANAQALADARSRTGDDDRFAVEETCHVQSSGDLAQGPARDTGTRLAPTRTVRQAA